MTIQIITELSKDACKRKLLDHMDTRLGAIWYSIGPIVGTIKGDDVVIQKRTAFFNNSFGRYKSRAEEAYLVEFLQDILTMAM